MERLLKLFLVVTIIVGMVGCASPGQPCAMPNAAAESGGAASSARGGQEASSKPETGRVYGAPNPTSVYARANAEVKSVYGTESRQAGAIANPKQWTGGTSSSATVQSSPPCVLAASKQLELLAVQAAGLEPGSKAWSKVMNRSAALLDFMATKGEAYMAQVIKLSPRFTRCVMVNLDLAGSSTGGQDAVDPKNSEAAAKGVAAAIEKTGAILNGEYESFPDAAPKADESPDASGGG